jgi:hypothetical protein
MEQQVRGVEKVEKPELLHWVPLVGGAYSESVGGGLRIRRRYGNGERLDLGSEANRFALRQVHRSVGVEQQQECNKSGF